MAISKAKKEKIYSDLLDGFKGASGVSFTKNNGLTVADISNLRTELRGSNARMMLAKKTIIKLAFKEVYGKDLSDEMLDGQIAIVFADGEDAVAPMGVISKHMGTLNTKDGDKILFVGSYFEGEIQDAATTKKLASLPSRDVLLAKFMGSLLSPVSGLARFFDGAKIKLEEISGKTVADLMETATKSEAPKSETSETVPAAPAVVESTQEVAQETPEQTPVTSETPEATAPTAEAPAETAAASEPSADATPAESPAEEK